MTNSNKSQVVQLKPGEYLFHEGDFPSSMFLLEKGILKVTKRVGPYDITLAELESPAVVGEMGFFDRQPRSASVICVKDAYLVELPYERLKDVYESRIPDWLKTLIKTLLEHIRKTNQLIVQIHSQNPQRHFLNSTRYRVKLLTLLKFMAGNHNGQFDQWLLNKYVVDIFGESINSATRLLSTLQKYSLVKIENHNDQITYQFLDISFIDKFLNWYFKQNIDLSQWSAEQISQSIFFLKSLMDFLNEEKTVNQISFHEFLNFSRLNEEKARLYFQPLTEMGWLEPLQVETRGKFWPIENPEKMRQELMFKILYLELALPS